MICYFTIKCLYGQGTVASFFQFRLVLRQKQGSVYPWKNNVYVGYKLPRSFKKIAHLNVTRIGVALLNGLCVVSQGLALRDVLADGKVVHVADVVSGHGVQPDPPCTQI